MAAGTFPAAFFWKGNLDSTMFWLDSLDWGFLPGLGSIVMIDIYLAGDNVAVIAMVALTPACPMEGSDSLLRGRPVLLRFSTLAS